MTRNVNPVEGGPAGGQLEAKVAAYYMLAMLCKAEPRGMPASVAHAIKFQRGYEGHALDDIVVVGHDAAGAARTLEIQAKRTLDFTASDASYGKLIGQIVNAGGESEACLAAAISRTSAKIERHYHQLLILARKMSSGTALRKALDSERVTSQGMRDFARATEAQMRAAGAEVDDEALWALLRRLQILVFDFESPGAVSMLLASSLAQFVLPLAERNRHGDLWNALLAKALSYDADGGEITRVELVSWLKKEAGFDIQSSRAVAIARQRFADHSQAALDAIDSRVSGIALARTAMVEAAAAAAERARYVEIAGESGTGKSALLKALAEEQRLETRPLFLSPARIPPGGWLTLSAQLGFQASARDFLNELAAGGCTMLCIDALDRITDPGAQETVKDLVMAAAQLPMMRVIATVGSDFGDDQREWLPHAALSLLGTASVSLETLSEEEALELASADPRIAQLMQNAEARPLTRNLYQLRQLLSRSDPSLPVTEAALARSWWEKGPKLARARQRDRLKALRELGRQAISQAQAFDIALIDSAVTEDLVQADELVETTTGSKGVFRHDVLRDWSIANLLREEPSLREQLPFAALAPASLSRALEIYARFLLETDDGAAAWEELLARASAAGVHGSWRRAVLLALVRSEQGVVLLEKSRRILVADDGAGLRDLIRLTEMSDSRSGVDALVAAGLDRAAVPQGYRVPTNLSWTRLAIWLLGAVDTLEVPLGRDILHFFSSWLMAYGGRDDLSPAMVRQLYFWLSALEDGHERDVPENIAKLFASGRRHGARSGLVQEIRALFLTLCDKAPQQAEAYLRNHTKGKQRHHVVEDILKFSAAASRAAPTAMANFTIEALIEDERRYHAMHRSESRGRLSYHHLGLFPAAPTRGPFLAILRASAAEGLRLVRSVVAYGLGLDRRSNSDPPDEVLITLPSGVRRFPVSGSYFLSRQGAGSDAMISALRALEAWGHEQVEAGRPAMSVAEQILDGENVPAAFLAVAMDVLLSHLSGSDPQLAPFVAAPELLQLDWDRFTRDRVGVDRLGIDEEGSSLAKPSYADLTARPSRGTCLMWCAGELLFSAEESVLEGIRVQLRAERSRLDAAAVDPLVHTYDPRWQAEQALRRLNPTNWQETEVTLENGSTVKAREYVAPEDEEQVMAPLRERSDAAMSEMALIYPLVEALLDPSKRDASLIGRGLEWAKRQAVESPADDDEEDFERAQRWRAVIAVAALVNCVAGFESEHAWARPILTRAMLEPAPERLSRSMAQLRYHPGGLAVLGSVAIVASGDREGLQRLLQAATREDAAMIAALTSSFPSLAEFDPRLPKALLRIGIATSIHPERDWNDPGSEEAGQRARDQRLLRACAEELAWLNGGSEPAWPRLPPSRRFVERRRIRIGTAAALVDDDDEKSREPVTEWFNHQSGGNWLLAIERSPSTNTAPWLADFISVYQAWTSHAWGVDLNREAEIRQLPTDWLHPFERLRLRVEQHASVEAFASDYVASILQLPDHSFLELVEAVIPAADSQFWDEKSFPIEHLVALREAVMARLQECSTWTWRKDEVVDTIGTDIASALRALHFHTPISFVGAQCYLPSSASAFKPVVASLASLTMAAPGLSFISDLFLTVCERATDWSDIDPLRSAAESWMRVRETDAAFWRDHHFGARLCAWLTIKIERPAPRDTEAIDRIERTVDQLVAIGLAEAVLLEARLADLQPA